MVALATDFSDTSPSASFPPSLAATIAGCYPAGPEQRRQPLHDRPEHPPCQVTFPRGSQLVT